MFFIRDCKGRIVGRATGYKNHAAAIAQCNRRGASVYSQIWRAYEELESVKPENNLLYSIVHADALNGEQE